MDEVPKIINASQAVIYQKADLKWMYDDFS